jgi:hypothetical protein
MPTVTTNYICKNGSGVYQDLSGIFQGGNAGITTGFKIAGTTDLGSIFASVSGGPYINFPTNFIASSGQDLNLLFQAIQPFIINYGSPVVTYSNGKYLITMESNTSLTFIKNLSATYFIVAGGGGGGNGVGVSGGFFTTYLGGGGGGGGQVISNTFGININNTLTFEIGAGGSAGSGGNSTIMIINGVPYVGTIGGSAGSQAIGQPTLTGGYGGSSGSGHSGGSGSSFNGDAENYGGGGGGGGQAGSGLNANGYTGGTGGAGLQSTISGATITYGKGGNGGNKDVFFTEPGTNGTYGGGGGGGLGISGGNGGNGIAYLLITYP